MMLLTLLLSFRLLFAAGLPPDVVQASPAIDLRTLERAVLEFTNQERARQDLPPLAWDSTLAAIAREHSRDMAENGYLSHQNLQGEGPTGRARRHGYDVTKPLGEGRFSIGVAENLGQMPTGNVRGRGYVAPNARSVARALVEAWMESPEHRRNLLGKDHDRLGVGAAFDGTYYLATQNFF
ncbi:MAG: CAP domain-containing protein [Candidatus Zixiibacteriota bacterium]|nr:MAG: CAP domain-containing protein [candidate division Zixibacteria bacterium]